MPSKSLIGIPWRVAFALQDDGWILRQDIIWAKPNPMPESVKDRPTQAHEYVFLFSKQGKYHYDYQAVKEPAVYKKSRTAFRGKGSYTNNRSFDNSKILPLDPAGRGNHKSVDDRNLRSVWTIPTQGTPEAHFATFPEKLVEPCIKAGCPVGGMVLDPFGGSGTTAKVALRLGRDCTLIELNPDYVEIIRRRVYGVEPEPVQIGEESFKQQNLWA